MEKVFESIALTTLSVSFLIGTMIMAFYQQRGMPRRGCHVLRRIVLVDVVIGVCLGSALMSIRWGWLWSIRWGWLWSFVSPAVLTLAGQRMEGVGTGKVVSKIMLAKFIALLSLNVGGIMFIFFVMPVQCVILKLFRAVQALSFFVFLSVGLPVVFLLFTLLLVGGVFTTIIVGKFFVRLFEWLGQTKHE